METNLTHANPATDTIDRLSPTLRPSVPQIGYQTWTDLLFVHWRLPAAAVRPLIPPDLELDTWQGDAWVGLVPFHMSGVRPWWSPAVRGISNFHETNVRTYVHCQGKNPGVWFFSLEAANRLAVWIGRRFWNLNYQHATMRIEGGGNTSRSISPTRKREEIRETQTIHYHSVRRGPDTPGAICDLTAEIGPPLGSPIATPGEGGGHPLADTLEYFLAERYYLYVRTRRGELLRGQVHHMPYPLCNARLIHCRETLLAANRIHIDQPPCHVLYSPGVNVQVYPLVEVRSEGRGARREEGK